MEEGTGKHVNKGDKSKRSSVARSKTWLSYMLTIFMSNKMDSIQTDYIYNNKMENLAILRLNIILWSEPIIRLLIFFAGVQNDLKIMVKFQTHIKSNQIQRLNWLIYLISFFIADWISEA